MNMRTACAIFWISLLCGCTTAPRLAPIHKGESVAIVVVMGPQTNGVVKISNQALGNDMSVGVGSGAVAGGLWGLTCGPFAPFCVPLGAAAGMMTGMAAGGVVGLTGALPEQKAIELRDRMSQVRRSHDVLDELRRNVADRARNHWDLTEDRSRVEVNVELTDLQLTSRRDENVSLTIRVLVTVRPSDGHSPSMQGRKQFEYVGPFSTLNVWLDERSDFIDTTISNACQQIAAQIVSELALN